MALFPRKLASDEVVSRDVFNALVDAVTALRQSPGRADDVEVSPSLSSSNGRQIIRSASPLCVRRRPYGIFLDQQTAELEELVELVTDLHLGGSATAKVLTFDGMNWTEAETEEITVHDAINTFEGVSGARALVRFHRRSGRWIVWQLRC